MCSKPAYTSYKAAEIDARRIVRNFKRNTSKTVRKLKPYICPECSAVHLTSHSDTPLKKVG